MNEARLAVFPGSLEYRFASGGRRLELRPVPLSQVLAAAAAIDPRSCKRLLLGGGCSPLKHPQFLELVRECRKRGFNHLAVETEAETLARRGAATLLGRLGFREVFVDVGGFGGAGETRVEEGLRRVIAASPKGGPKVYLVAPLLRDSADAVEAILDQAIAAGGPHGFLLALPEIGRVAPEQRARLLPYSQQAEVAARLFRKCQGRNIEYGFTNKRGVSPCAVETALEPFATVFYDRAQYFRHAALEDGELVRVDACAQCSLTHSCRGIESAYVEHFGTTELRPVPLERSMNWKLRRINRLEEFEYRNISPFKNDSPVNPRGLIRINGHCNMSCAFCFVDRTAPDFDSRQLEREIEQMARGGTRHLVLSGGEPTLHPQLPELIGFARSQAAFDVIEMQSNGVKCADASYAAELVDAGLNKVTFSLHSIDPEHSDSITRLPKAFGKTIQAIHNFRELGVLTQIAHVLTKANYKELPDTVRYLGREFPAQGGHLSICLAIAQGISDLVFQWVIPTFTEIKPYVSDALDYCLERGIGFGGMIGQGGYPPCMLDGELRYYEAVLDKVFKSDDSSDQFFKPERCRECSFDAYCLGPRRSYVEHYGDAEIRPFRRAVPAPPAGAPEGSADPRVLVLAAAANVPLQPSPRLPPTGLRERSLQTGACEPELGRRREG